MMTALQDRSAEQWPFFGALVLFVITSIFNASDSLQAQPPQLTPPAEPAGAIEALNAFINQRGPYTAQGFPEMSTTDLGEIHRVDRQLSGLRSCSRCPQNAPPSQEVAQTPSSPQPDDSIFPVISGSGDDWYLGDEMTTWRTYDKHSQAYAALQSDLAKVMAKVLKVEENGESQIHRDVRCLACHSSVPVSQLLEGGHAVAFAPSDAYSTLLFPKTGKDAVFASPATGDEIMAISQHLITGVNCEGCHGPSGSDSKSNSRGWGELHYGLENWRAMPSKEKFQHGLYDLRSDVNRTKVCASCHVGDASLGRVVTHDMYAAGHPPLPNFEVSTFANQQPYHWKDLFRKRRGLVRNFAKSVNIDGPLPADDRPIDIASKTTGSLISGMVSMSQLLTLSADIVHASQTTNADGVSINPHLRWPEFANFACFNCHHDLKVESWRSKRIPMLKPGRPNLHEWPYSAVSTTLLTYEKSDEYQKLLTPVLESLNRVPFGETAGFETSSRKLAEWLENEAWNLSQHPLTKADLPVLMMKICELNEKNISDYDSTRQLIWTYSVAYDEYNELDGIRPKPLIHRPDHDGWYSGPLSTLPGRKEIETGLHELDSLIMLDLNEGRYGKQTSISLPGPGPNADPLTVRAYLSDLNKVFPRISNFEADAITRNFELLKVGAEKLQK